MERRSTREAFGEHRDGQVLDSVGRLLLPLSGENPYGRWITISYDYVPETLNDGCRICYGTLR
ncbi:MAG: hypothetical protein WD061_03690 [Candidatus Saccharimonadales bacterium]